MDIFNNTTPFGLLSGEGQDQIMSWKGDFLYYIGGKGEEKDIWGPCTHKPIFYRTIVYRAVKPAPTKPSINWDHVAKEWNALAADRSGRTYLYGSIPRKYEEKGYWVRRDGRPCPEAPAFTSFVRGTCDWEDSLVVRPGYVES